MAKLWEYDITEKEQPKKKTPIYAPKPVVKVSQPVVTPVPQSQPQPMQPTSLYTPQVSQQYQGIGKSLLESPLQTTPSQPTPQFIDRKNLMTDAGSAPSFVKPPAKVETKADRIDTTIKKILRQEEVAYNDMIDVKNELVRNPKYAKQKDKVLPMVQKFLKEKNLSYTQTDAEQEKYTNRYMTPEQKERVIADPRIGQMLASVEERRIALSENLGRMANAQQSITNLPKTVTVDGKTYPIDVNAFMGQIQDDEKTKQARRYLKTTSLHTNPFTGKADIPNWQADLKLGVAASLLAPVVNSVEGVVYMLPPDTQKAIHTGIYNDFVDLTEVASGQAPASAETANIASMFAISGGASALLRSTKLFKALGDTTKGLRLFGKVIPAPQVAEALENGIIGSAFTTGQTMMQLQKQGVSYDDAIGQSLSAGLQSFGANAVGGYLLKTNPTIKAQLQNGLTQSAVAYTDAKVQGMEDKDAMKMAYLGFFMGVSHAGMAKTAEIFDKVSVANIAKNAVKNIKENVVGSTPTVADIQNINPAQTPNRVVDNGFTGDVIPPVEQIKQEPIQRESVESKSIEEEYYDDYEEFDVNKVKIGDIISTDELEGLEVIGINKNGGFKVEYENDNGDIKTRNIKRSDVIDREEGMPYPEDINITNNLNSIETAPVSEVIPEQVTTSVTEPTPVAEKTTTEPVKQPAQYEEIPTGTKVYHGTSTVFDYFDRDFLSTASNGGAGTKDAFFFSTDKNHAKYWGEQAVYAKGKKNKPVIIEANINPENPLTIDLNNYTENDYGEKIYTDIPAKESSVIEDSIDYAKKNNHDAILFKNIYDNPDADLVDMWAVLNEDIIKINKPNKPIPPKPESQAVAGQETQPTELKVGDAVIAGGKSGTIISETASGKSYKVAFDDGTSPNGKVFAKGQVVKNDVVPEVTAPVSPEVSDTPVITPESPVSVKSTQVEETPIQVETKPVEVKSENIRPRLAEDGKSLINEIIKLSKEGVVTEKGIGYPIIGNKYVYKDGEFQEISSSGLGTKKLSAEKQDDIFDSINKDMLNVDIYAFGQRGTLDEKPLHIKNLHTAHGFEFKTQEDFIASKKSKPKPATDDLQSPAVEVTTAEVRDNIIQGIKHGNVTEEEFNDALKILKSKLGSFNSGIPLDKETLVSTFKVSRYLIGKGYDNFQTWSTEMVSKLGDSIRPHLKNIWDNIQNQKGGEVSPELARKLDKEETITTYRAMQLIDDELYPPMSAEVEKGLREPAKKGVWEKSEERPDLVSFNSKSGQPEFKLKKGNKTTISARYNPYLHSSSSPLNDQFTSAYSRPNMVVVEVEIPKSELASGYRAELAKNSVGIADWKAGGVDNSLPADKQRTVYLSRYNKIKRIVPDSEVADVVAKHLKGIDVEVPINAITPSLREELVKRGIKIGYPEKNAKLNEVEYNKLKQIADDANNSKPFDITKNKEASDALNVLKKKMGNIGMGVPLDGETIKAVYTVGKFYYQEGLTEFNKWSEQMGTHINDTVKPYLKSVFNHIVSGKDFDVNAIKPEELQEQPTELNARTKKGALPPLVTPSPLRDGKPIKRIRQMIHDFEKATGIVLIPRKKLSGGAPGSYKPSSGGISMTKGKDLGLVMHEVAHRLDDTYKVFKDWVGSKTSPYDAELSKFWDYGSATKTGPRSSIEYKRAEGLAEFFKAYMKNPDEAIKMAPKLYEYLKTKMPDNAWKAIDDFTSNVRRYIGSGIMTDLNWQADVAQTIGDKVKDIFQLDKFEVLSPLDMYKYHFEDQLAPLWAAVRKTPGFNESMLPENNPYLLGRLLAGHDSVVIDMINNGMRNVKIEKIEGLESGLKGFYKALGADKLSDAELNAKLEDAKKFLLSERVMELAERFNRETGLTGAGGGVVTDLSIAKNDYDEIMAKGTDYVNDIMEFVQYYRKWADANMRYLVDSGIMSEDAYAEIKEKNQHYAAMNRVMEKGEVYQKGGKTTSLKVDGDVIKAVKGSERDIVDPILSLFRTSDRVVREGKLNEFWNAWTKMFDDNRQMYEGNVSEQYRVMEEVTTKNGNKPPDTKNVVKVFKEGQVRYYRINPEVYKAISGMNSTDDLFAGIEWLNTVAKVPAKILRTGVIYSPAFMVKNVFRDFAERVFQSNVDANVVESLPSNVTNDAISELYSSGGGQSTNYMRDEISYKREQRKLARQMSKDGKSFVGSMEDLLNAYTNLAEKSELSGRISEYKKAYNYAKEVLKYDDYNAQLYAGFNARDVLDYARIGAFIKRIAPYNAFLNPSIQGQVKSRDFILKNPKLYLKRLAMFGIASELAVMMAAEQFGYEEEYNALPSIQKDFFHNFKISDNLWLRIPKGFVSALMTSSARRMFDFAKGNKNAFEGLGKSAVTATIPIEDITTLLGGLKTSFELYANKNFYTDQPIVSPFEIDKDIKYRTGAKYSSKLSQKLYEALPITKDPRYIDHVIETMAGNMGKNLIRLSASGTRKMTGADTANMLTGLFAQSPGYSAPEIQFVEKNYKSVNMSPNSIELRQYMNAKKAFYEATTAKDKDIKSEKWREVAKQMRSNIEKKQKELKNMPNPWR